MQWTRNISRFIEKESLQNNYIYIIIIITGGNFETSLKNMHYDIVLLRYSHRIYALSKLQLLYSHLSQHFTVTSTCFNMAINIQILVSIFAFHATMCLDVSYIFVSSIIIFDDIVRIGNAFYKIDIWTWMYVDVQLLSMCIDIMIHRKEVNSKRIK